MPKLFDRNYPDDARGAATMKLATVATGICTHYGMLADADTRINLVIEMHAIGQDDLTADLQPLHDEFAEYLGVA